MIRKIPQIAVNIIARFEGFSPIIYICPAGIKTIAYGHALRPGEDEKFRNGVTEDEGKQILEQDMLQAATSVCRLTTVPLTDEQYAALLSFVFNLGGATYQRSTLRSMLNRGRYLEAADEFPKWCWGGGRKLIGLYRRRMIERNLFLAGANS